MGGFSKFRNKCPARQKKVSSNNDNKYVYICLYTHVYTRQLRVDIHLAFACRGSPCLSRPHPPTHCPSLFLSVLPSFFLSPSFLLSLSFSFFCLPFPSFSLFLSPFVPFVAPGEYRLMHSIIRCVSLPGVIFVKLCITNFFFTLWQCGVYLRL